MTNMSDKKLYTLRYLSYWLYILCTIGTPIALVAWQFDLFKKPGGLQLTGYAIILLIFVAFLGGKHIKRAIADMELSLAKTILQNLILIVPFLILWVILTFLESFISQIRFIALCTVLGLLCAAFIDFLHTKIVQECNSRKDNAT